LDLVSASLVGWFLNIDDLIGRKIMNGFGKNPSQRLQEAFSERPFQIQEPEKAKIIFLGLDANWDENIEQ
jgi:hypothetical protein